MRNAIEITAMREEHVAAVSELEKTCFSLPWSENSVRGELTNPLSLWLVALENGRVVGYIGSQSVADEADMMNVAVAPDRRRCGIGQRLVCELCRQLDENGVCALTLEVRTGNDAARTMYRNLDFQEIGVRKNYYTKPKEDAVIMKKTWAASRRNTML